MLQLDPQSDVSRTEQIVVGIRTRIERGTLAEGARLPSVRNLAASCGASPFTVAEAYNRLVAAGLIEARRARGYFVSAQQPPRRTDPQPAQVDDSWLLQRVYEGHGLSLPAGVGWLPPDWLYEEGVRSALRTLAKAEGASLTRYGHPQGLPALRQHLQWRLAMRGIEATSEQVLLTHGASQGLDLALRLWVKPGDAVLVDEPGYSTLLAALRLYGARIVGVPRTANGPDVATLALLAKEHKPSAFFTNSALHNPTGTTTSAQVAHQILRLAEQFDFRIVEDDPFADLLNTAPPTLASLDGLQHVAYLGSFSKTMSPALRVGYLAGDAETVRRATQLKMASSLTGSEISEAATLHMLMDGHHRAHLERLRERLADSQLRVCTRLAELGWRVFHRPTGGLFLWAAAPAAINPNKLAVAAANAGIALAPGRFYLSSDSETPYFRFNAAWSNDSRLFGWLAAQTDGVNG
jgi:DNA-binding transcriptional MocR family regulator